MPGPGVVSLGHVTRTSPGRIAACLATGVLTFVGLIWAVPAAATPRAAADDATPLQVSIDTLSPSTVPTRGVVTVTGEVTNTSSETWTDLKVYMLTSASPMTSPEELAAASASEAASTIGSRLYTEGLYARVGDLAPGESVPYTLAVKRTALGIGTAPGVYWLGVHVLGTENGARDPIADGRARTFLPLVPAHTRPSDLALLMPVEEPVRRDRHGRLLEARKWRGTFAADGRLDRLVRLSNDAAGRPLTWLLDPAVLDAARSVSQDNPPLDIAPTDGTADPAASAQPSPSGSPSPSQPPAGSDGTQSQSALNATNWLSLLERQASAHAVLTLPYGDLDVASALHKKRPAVYTTATDLSTRTAAGFGIDATPVVAPASGYLPGAALRKVDPGTPMVLGQGAYPEAQGSVLTTPGGGHVVLNDAGAASGGPNPEDRFSAVSVRQRILSEAALHALSTPRGGPLVLSTPRYWDPGAGWGTAGFFQGLDQPWLHLVDLPSVVAGATGTTAAGQPAYPRSEAGREVPFANLLATQEVGRVGRTFANLLTRNNRVDDELAKIGVLASSSAARRHPDAALLRARAATHEVRSEMEQVQVEGPPFVTMSSEEGPIQITLVNNLDEEVTVAVRALTRTKDVKIAGTDPITLGPGKRASVRLTARAKDIGVHSVTLVATDSAGNPLGSTAQFTVRTSQVGLVIWAIIGVGGAVLLAAIVMRTVRRVRHRRATRSRLMTEGGA